MGFGGTGIELLGHRPDFLHVVLGRGDDERVAGDIDGDKDAVALDGHRARLSRFRRFEPLVKKVLEQLGNARRVGIGERDEAERELERRGGLIQLTHYFFDQFHLLATTGHHKGIGADVRGNRNGVDQGAAFGAIRHSVFSAAVGIGGQFLAGLEHAVERFGDGFGIGKAQREEADIHRDAQRYAVEQADEFAHPRNVFFHCGDDETVRAVVGDDAVGFLQIDRRKFRDFAGRARLTDEQAINNFFQSASAGGRATTTGCTAATAACSRRLLGK